MSVSSVGTMRQGMYKAISLVKASLSMLVSVEKKRNFFMPD